MNTFLNGGIYLKKWMAGVIIGSGLLLLSACGGVDVVDYVDVTFSGNDTEGTADYEVDQVKMLSDAFDIDPDTNPENVNEETIKEAQDAQVAYEVILSQTEALSNGDKITVEVIVDEDKTNKLEGGKKTIKVSGLKEAKD